jgi:2-oxoglutarate/2-oxoacid ferredoxin oxidoreductase subunit beta
MSQENTLSFRSSNKPTWCPGCGDFGVLSGVERALLEFGRPPHEVAVVGGIGCSSRMPFFLSTYGFHSVHGRGLCVATGLKTARPDLTVIAVGGDGDALAIGGNHFFHTMRRNIDITYILMDNQIYGMTKGQTAPTSAQGLQTKSTPHGNPDAPVDPAWVALSCGATYVAQALSTTPKQVCELVLGGLRHRGIAFINILSPCVTFHPEVNKDTIKAASCELPQGHDPSSRRAALNALIDAEGKHPLGLIYQDPTSRSFDERVDSTLTSFAQASRTLESLVASYT